MKDQEKAGELATAPKLAPPQDPVPLVVSLPTALCAVLRELKTEFDLRRMRAQEAEEILNRAIQTTLASLGADPKVQGWTLDLDHGVLRRTG